MMAPPRTLALTCPALPCFSERWCTRRR